MSPPVLTFFQLKRSVSIETVLNAEGLTTSLKRHGQRLVVVESPWGVIRLMQIGFPTVALLGIQLSTTQLQLLHPSPRIVLMLDGDHAGRSASRKIANTLTQHTGIRVHRIELPRGLDPDDLSDTDLRHRLHLCFS